MTKTVLSFIENQKASGKAIVRLRSTVGENMEVFPTTSILSGKAVSDYESVRQNYLLNKNVNHSEEFLEDKANLNFGYWGKVSSLEKIRPI